jgi:phosphoglycerate kinase
LENVRFYAGDEDNDPVFAELLAENFDVFVNDAFSASHRNHASVTGVAKILPSCAGFRLLEEIHEMTFIKDHPVSPAVAIIGGAKIETKLPVIKFFEEKYDHILVGGKIANEALDQKIEFSEKVVLPIDFVDDRFDIGPKTVEKFKEIIATAKTIAWNGPTGKYEDKKYSHSSNEILQAVIESEAFVLVGGGETIDILEKNNAMHEVSFVSTGGGAMLDFIGGNTMPGIEALKN